MRTPYQIPQPAEPLRPGEGSASLRLAQVATLVFWLPLLSVDIWMVTSWSGRPEGYAHAFQALFRETIIYMGFWLLVGVIQAMVFSRARADRRPTRRQARLTQGESAKLGNAAITRERMGL